MKFAWIQTEKATYSVAKLCRGVVARIVPGPHDAHRQDPH